MSLYQAYCLTFQSDLDIPEFQYLEGDGVQADVQIRLAPVSEVTPDPTSQSNVWQIVDGGFLIGFAGVARYFVTGGNRIDVDVAQGADLVEVRNFLLGSVLAALLQQRKLLTVHASAIVTPQGAVLFAGRSGLGKSTLMTQFQNSGFEVLSDDVTAIRMGQNGPEALPAFRRSRLTKTTLDVLGMDTDLPMIGSSIRKYQVNIPRLCANPHHAHAVCMLNFGTETTAKAEPMLAAQGLKDLYRLTYRGNFMTAMGLGAERFAMAGAVARQAQFLSVTRSPTEPSFDDVFRAVSDQLELGA